MFEDSFSLFQLVGISFTTMIFGMTIGVMWGRSVQRKRDLKMWGPDTWGKRRGR
jgi:hypothetical protein